MGTRPSGDCRARPTEAIEVDRELNIERTKAMAFLARRSPNGWVEAAPGAVGIYTGAGTFTANGVMTTSADVALEDLDRLAAPFQGLPVSSWAMQLAPEPSEDERALARSLGLTREGKLPTMTFDLRGRVPDGPSSSVVRRVLPADAVPFGETIAAAFGSTPSETVQFSSAEVLSAPEVTAFWILDAASQPVSVGMSVSVSATHTGLYAIGTVESGRRQGHGFAITSALLKDARRRNSRIAYLQASPLGRPVYERVGFHVSEYLTYLI